jgi:hypothetical protein
MPVLDWAGKRPVWSLKVFPSSWFEEGGVVAKKGAVIGSGTGGGEQIVIGGEKLGVVAKTRWRCNRRPFLAWLFGGLLVLARVVKVALDHCN